MDKPDTGALKAAQQQQESQLKQQQQEQEQQAFQKFRSAQQSGFGSSGFGSRLGGGQSSTLGS